MYIICMYKSMGHIDAFYLLTVVKWSVEIGG